MAENITFLRTKVQKLTLSGWVNDPKSMSGATYRSVVAGGLCAVHANVEDGQASYSVIPNFASERTSDERFRKYPLGLDGDKIIVSLLPVQRVVIDVVTQGLGK